MRMKAKWMVRVVAPALVLVLVAFFYHEWYTWKSTRELHRFQTEFGITLPANSQIVFSKKMAAWDGGGELLYIYRLNDEAISTLIEQGKQAGWSALPFPAEQITFFQDKLKSNEGAMTRNLPYAMTKGFGIAFDRPPSPGRTIAANFVPPTNFTIGLIDPDTNQVYCYAYDS